MELLRRSRSTSLPCIALCGLIISSMLSWEHGLIMSVSMRAKAIPHPALGAQSPGSNCHTEGGLQSLNEEMRGDRDQALKKMQGLLAHLFKQPNNSQCCLETWSPRRRHELRFLLPCKNQLCSKKKNSCSIFLLDIPSDGKQRELFINPNFLEAFCLLHHPGPWDSKRLNSYNDSNHRLPTAVFITAAHVYCACTCQALLSILNSLTPHFILTSTLWNGWLLSSYYR